MLPRAFFAAVTMDEASLLDQLLSLLAAERITWCLIGGLGVNAYVDPVVTLDLDLVVATSQIELLATRAASAGLRVERFAHSINLSQTGSGLRIQLQTDPRYGSFIARAQMRPVLGIPMPVAAVEDLLQGKIWAFQDDTRRASKRQKDLADISRLLEAFPDLRARVPTEILQRLV